MTIVRVSIVEDQDDLRQNLAININGRSGILCSHLFSNAEDAMRETDHENTDVVLMDIGLPKASGIEATRAIKHKYPDIQIIILTIFEDPARIFEALKAGATGYLLKKSSPEKIVESIHEVVAGGSPMSGEIARKVVQSFKSPVESSAGLKLLTTRETELLNLLARGYRYKEISEKMFISMNTVQTHIRHIYEKLQVQSGIEAINKIYHP